MHKGHPTQAASSDTLQQALVVAAYLIKTYPHAARDLAWTLAKIRAEIASDPLRDAEEILAAHTRDGGVKQIRDKSLYLNLSST